MGEESLSGVGVSVGLRSPVGGGDGRQAGRSDAVGRRVGDRALGDQSQKRLDV